ncbi:cysteine--tRNA ligase [Candidatus Micrarchaeota archaeon]|nr:cysteine--tRNA ligase [Candidatus Micrarchaeota archaeon]
MRVFNSLTKEKEEFAPIEEGKVVMYVCGLTPYDSAHIGHARTYVSFDVLKRYLIKKGLEVLHIQNITDVEDKIIKRCLETGADPIVLTTEVHDEAMELFKSLHIIPADVYPKVTGHIKEITDMVIQIMERSYAYETGSGIYFNVQKFRDYGRLSGQDIEHMKAGARKEMAEDKQSPLDFALWKKTKGEILEFDSPWGRGRPGWHIECSALAKKYGKRTLDIHGGARDLIFPHHENEIAQSEAANGEKFCNYWLHTGFLTVNGEKMSKSLGNFITLKQALSRFSPNAMRLFYLQAHYRSPLDYDEEKLEAGEESIQRIFNSLGLIEELEQGESNPDEEFRKKTMEYADSFYSNMGDDLNTPEAIADLFGVLRLANSHLGAQKPDREHLRKLRKEIESMLWILGLERKKADLESKKEELLEIVKELNIPASPSTAKEALGLLISKREEARKQKDYQTSDRIRARLREAGIIFEDKPEGTRWKLG